MNFQPQSAAKIKSLAEFSADPAVLRALKSKWNLYCFMPIPQIKPRPLERAEDLRDCLYLDSFLDCKRRGKMGQVMNLSGHGDKSLSSLKLHVTSDWGDKITRSVIQAGQVQQLTCLAHDKCKCYALR